MNKVLFITFNALTEPLGQSQILPYIYGNSSKYNFYVCSLEKYDSVSTPSLVSSVRECCLQRNILWFPSKFRSKPKYLSTLINLIKVGFNSLRIIQKHDVSVIHCRSYLPAFLGMILKKICKTNFIFDMRGLWIDELIASGSIKKQTILQKILVYLEKAALNDASQIITLTHKSKNFLISNYLIDEKKISVIPTCVDQSLFTDFSKKSLGSPDNLIKKVGILGTVLSGWFNFEMLITFLQAIKKRWPGAEIHFVTKESANDVLASFKDHGFDIQKFTYKIYPVEREGLAQCISQFDIGAMFYFSESFSEIARSPTKIGEFLACKTPIIINSGVGDTDKIIRDYGVGLLVDRDLLNDADLLNNQIEEMLNDDDLEIRCIRCCEDIFSLDLGISSYAMIYQKILKSEYEKN